MSSATPPPLFPGEHQFTLLPEAERNSEVRGLSGVRLYVGKYTEHRQAYAFAQERARLRRGSSDLVRALLLYHDYLHGYVTPADPDAHPNGRLRVADEIEGRLARLEQMILADPNAVRSGS